jgi:hypothetical protein
MEWRRVTNMTSLQISAPEMTCQVRPRPATPASTDRPLMASPPLVRTRGMACQRMRAGGDERRLAASADDCGLRRRAAYSTWAPARHRRRVRPEAQHARSLLDKNAGVVCVAHAGVAAWLPTSVTPGSGAVAYLAAAGVVRLRRGTHPEDAPRRGRARTGGRSSAALTTGSAQLARLS